MLSSLKWLSQPLCPDIWGGEADSQALAREQYGHSPGLLFRAKWWKLWVKLWVTSQEGKLNFFNSILRAALPETNKQSFTGRVAW